ncbi:MAG: SGNH/GDSL hydrolase family protein [Chloroflexaceae bacterium]
MRRPLPVILVALLLASLALNGYLFQQERMYHRMFNSTLLDPLGLAAFADEAPPPRRPGQRVVVFFGDSRAASWPAPQVPEEMIIVNRGIGGQTTSQVAWRFAPHVAPLRPDTLIVQVGINDLKTLPVFPEYRETIIRNCKANLQTIVDLALEAGVREVILTTVFFPGPLPIEKRFLWGDVVTEAVKEVNTHLQSLAGDRVVLFDSARILSEGSGSTLARYSSDYLHLNADRYAMLNRELAPMLRR